MRAPVFSILISLSALCCVSAQIPTAHTAAEDTAGEARATHAFEAAKKMGPGELYAFLRPMPKGADLHMHLSGAVYAETFLAEAIQQGLCINTTALKFSQPVANDSASACAVGSVSASTVNTDEHLYDELVDAFSMRDFIATSGFSGHDQFFSTFVRFSGLKEYTGAWLDKVATRAAAQNEQYLEIMVTPPFGKAAAAGFKIGWPEGADREVSREQLAALRHQLLATGLRVEVVDDAKQIADAVATQKKVEMCRSDSPPLPDLHGGGGYHAACTVKIRFLYQVLRAFPPQQVFAQALLAFETVNAQIQTDHPEFVGINFVQPEDDRIAMKDYHLQMEMLDYLHSVYPKVHISLHAGELAFGMVPPEGLSFHIHQAIDLGHAERIGHGVDVLYEDHPAALLQEMAEKHIMVEINLTSNDVILGIKGPAHPLHAYMAAHVPWALSTDDEGVSRIDLTHEYVKGAEDQNLTYLDLKQSARTALEHAFLPGASLWAAPDNFTRKKAACAAPIATTSIPDSDCAALLSRSERASEQWQLEHRFATFEASIH